VKYVFEVLVGAIAAYILGAGGLIVGLFTFAALGVIDPEGTILLYRIGYTGGAFPGLGTTAIYLLVYPVLRLYLRNRKLYDKEKNSWIFSLILTGILALLALLITLWWAQPTTLTPGMRIPTSTPAPQYTFAMATLICQDCTEAGTLITLWAIPEKPEVNEVTGELPSKARVTILGETVTDDGVTYYHVSAFDEARIRQAGWVSEEYIQEINSP